MNEAIEYLESEEYLKQGRLEAYSKVFVRPMFETLLDDESESVHDQGKCGCMGSTPNHPLESTPWAPSVERDWLKLGTPPRMNPQAREKHWGWAHANNYMNNLIM